MDGGDGLEIKDTSFLGGALAPNAAVLLLNSQNVDIRNVDIHGFRDGVRGDAITKVRIRNSNFSNNQASVGISDAYDIRIEQNHISGRHASGCSEPCKGIWLDDIGLHSAPPPPPGAGVEEGARVDHNFIHDTDGGLTMNNGTHSIFSHNQVFDNSIVGIGLFEISFDNQIKFNLTFNNGVDLHHDEDATPNKWKDNGCETSVGLDIPNCNP